MKSDKQSPLPVKPIRRDSIPEKITREIKQLVESGHLGPGSKLPPERELAQILGVSRPSVREALGALSLLGVIENRTGSGTFLSDTPGQWASESFGILFLINKSALFEIFEARKSLEGSVAALAAQRRTDEHLAALKEALAGMKANLNHGDEYQRFEKAFHQAVIEAADNQVIAQLMQKLYAMLQETRERFRDIGVPIESRREQDYLNHEAVYLCIKSQDESGASKAMIDHLLKFENQLNAEREKDA